MWMAAIILALCLPFNDFLWSPSAEAAKYTAEELKALKIRDSIQKETKKMNVEQKKKYYDKVINSIVKEAKKEKSDVRKLIVINDRLAERITYDFDTFEKTKKENNESYSKLGAIVNGTAVCNGYMEVLQDVLTKVGFENKTIIDRKMNHAWNLVKIGKDYYHIDLTWNDGSDLQGYEYFLLDDETIKNRGHETYQPKKNEKATSKTYLAFSNKKDEYTVTMKLKEDKSGIYFYSYNQPSQTNEIFMVDYNGKKKMLQSFDQTNTYFLKFVNNQLYFKSYEENVNYSLIRINTDDLSKKEVLFSSEKDFSYQFTQKEVITTQYISVWGEKTHSWLVSKKNFSL